MKRYMLTVDDEPDEAPGFNQLEAALQRARLLFRLRASVVVWEWGTRRVAALYRG